MNFQERVGYWMLACFGLDDTASVKQRAFRMLEEANELAQAVGVTAEEAHQLVDYVQSRPVGDPVQELGGVLLTVSGLATALNLDMEHAGEMELNRCWVNLPAIQAKNATKKADSALPGVLPPAAPSEATAQPPCTTCRRDTLHKVATTVHGETQWTWACTTCEEQAAMESKAWDLYCDETRNNRFAAESWDKLPQTVRDRYILRARTNSPPA